MSIFTVLFSLRALYLSLKYFKCFIRLQFSYLGENYTLSRIKKLSDFLIRKNVKKMRDTSFFINVHINLHALF